MSNVPAKEFFTPDFLGDPYPTYRRYLDGRGLQYIAIHSKSPPPTTPFQGFAFAANPNHSPRLNRTGKTQRLLRLYERATPSPGRCSLPKHQSGSDFLSSPWQNGIAERWVGSCRRDVLDHVIAINEGHVKRLLTEYWSVISKVRKPVGRRRTPKEVRDLICQMMAENPTWGAPRIHGELLMLGFDISERTVSRWMKRMSRSPDRAKRWLAFLRNHREAIAAMDFFTVPTITFSVLYCFFLIGHDRRRILHCNVTRHPTSLWIVRQLREAFPFDSAPRFLIFDRDAKYGEDVPAAVRSLNMNPVRTSFASPWQNGVAERWIESCRRELLDHVIAVNERHLKRLLFDYVRYHHEDRTHLGLGKGTPAGRICSANAGRVISHDRLGGLHHRYDRAA